jgi:hypothetical protein
MKKLFYLILVIVLILITLKVSLSETINSSNYTIDTYGGIGYEVNSSNYTIDIFISGILGVNATETYNLTLGIFSSEIQSYCGDGVVDVGEYCDLGDFGGKSCLDYGYSAGYLLCTATCDINAILCHDVGTGSGGYSTGTSGGNVTNRCLEGNIIKQCRCGAEVKTEGYCFNNIWYPIIPPYIFNETDKVILNDSRFEIQFQMNNDTYLIFNNVNTSKFTTDQKLILDFNIIPFGKYVQDITFTCDGNLCGHSSVLFPKLTLAEQENASNRIIIFLTQLESNTNYKMTLTGNGKYEAHDLLIKINTMPGDFTEEVEGIFKKKIEIFGLEINKWLVCVICWLFLLLLSYFIKNHWIKLIYVVLITISSLYFLIFYGGVYL